VLRIKTYYRAGLPVHSNQHCLSIHQFAEETERLYHSHRELGGDAGMWMELASSCREELHVGVSDMGWAILYVLCLEPLISIAIMHADGDDPAFQNFQYIGDVNLGALHPRAEAIEVIWRWAQTGQLDIRLKECLGP
jgi:hypothetical protein